MSKSAIVVITYNRIESLKRLLQSLSMAKYPKDDNVTLIISIDYSGCDDIFNYASNFRWDYGEKIIKKYEEKQGLKNHVLQCGDYTDLYDFIIVLEDDIYVSDSFYYYGKQAVNFYKNDSNISGISLYSHNINWLNRNYFFSAQKRNSDVFFMRLAKSWGQIWTKEQWKPFKDWLKNNNTISNSEKIPKPLIDWPESSWLKYHHKYCIMENKYFVYPYDSLSTNFTDQGTHNNQSIKDYQVSLVEKKEKFAFVEYSSERIIYDEYMERMNIGEYIGVRNEELCVDIYGNKPEYLYRKFLLTTKILNYKIVKSFSLSLRPIESSVINNLKGNEIFLYDTDEIIKNKNKIDENLLERYFWRVSDYIKGFKYNFVLMKKHLIIKIKEIIR